MPRDLEHLEQAALFEWAQHAQARFPELEYLHAIPNGGYRHIAVARRLKAEGVKPGPPDIYLDVPRHGFHGLRIEMKRKSGRGIRAGVLSEAQSKWIDHLAEQGYFVAICNGWMAARDTIIGYLESGYE